MKNKKITRLILLILAVVLVLGAVPFSASAASSKEIQKQIDGLKSQKAELQKEIEQLQVLRYLQEVFI